MPRKQFLTMKEEPEDSFDFHELFPVVNECPFSSLPPNEPLGLEPIEPKQTKMENYIPALWYIEKGRVDEEYPNGVPENRSLSQLGVTKQETLEKFIPQERQLPADVAERAEDLKEQERMHHEHFIATMLSKYPVDNSYHPNKARKYSQDQDTSNDEEYKRQTTARKTNNDKSIESRYKKKVERAVNAYTIIHLRERILEYQTRMNIMKEMMLQTNTCGQPIDEQSIADDLSSLDESDMESLSSISSY